MKKRVQATIKGRVQGVGFRPTVYRYAAEESLSGSVRNEPSGVVVEVEGDEEGVARFLARLEDSPPAQARVEKISIRELSIEGSTVFNIIPSLRSGDLKVGMPPDIATCDKCREELFSPGNRRYLYPFINCTVCGPRFTIIKELPYDREKTSMDKFTLCEECQREYSDPRDRRFDSQPNACFRCGPALKIISADGEYVSDEPVVEAARLLRRGSIGAIKGLGGYHLCCNAEDEKAISLLRERKQRPHKALAVMFSTIEEIEEHCHVDKEERGWLLSFQRPIVILQRKDGSRLSGLVSPDSNDVGAFLPYTPLHYLLLSEISPLVMTSGNLAEEPIVHDEEDLKRILGRIADCAIVHDRPIIRRCDDSVLRLAKKRPLVLRRSRGFVPDPVDLQHAGPTIVACGGDMKNVFSITRGSQAFLSQHIGDLEEYSAFRFYQESMEDLVRLLKVEPEIIAYDLHPNYISSRYAVNSGIGKKVGIQHHHAHIASCMAEHGLAGPVIGVALDGTGYGPDGTMWGGEFLVADLRDYRRRAHFKQYPMPGGDEAVRHPIRMALSCLLTDAGPSLDPGFYRIFEGIPEQELDVITNMVNHKIHSPMTSSCGRLFDAISALIGLCGSISYEGQAAVRLQSMASSNIEGTYPYIIEHGKDVDVVSFSQMILQIAADCCSKVDKRVIASMFHNTLAAAVREMCERLRSRENINNIILSGGVFQNNLFLVKVAELLGGGGFNVYCHNTVPPNDGGLSLGQAAIALARYGDDISKNCNRSKDVPCGSFENR